MLLHEIRCFFQSLITKPDWTIPSAEIAVPGFVCAGSLGAVEQLLQKARRSEGCKQVEIPEIHPLVLGDLGPPSHPGNQLWGPFFLSFTDSAVRLQDRVGVENPFDVTWKLWVDAWKTGHHEHLISHESWCPSTFWREGAVFVLVELGHMKGKMVQLTKKSDLSPRNPGCFQQMNAPGFWTLQLSIKSGIRRIDVGNFAWKEVVETWKSMRPFPQLVVQRNQKKPCVFCCKKHCIHPKIPFSHEFDLWKTEMKSYSLFLSLFLNYMLELKPPLNFVNLVIDPS